MFYSFVTLFGVLSQYFNSDPLRYCLLDTQVLRSGDLGKELLISGLSSGFLQTFKVCEVHAVVTVRALSVVP